METIDIEVLLATGYAVLLVAVAFGLELVARHAHRHSEQWRVAGFQYRPEHDLWECPAGERLERVSFDHGSVVARYRAPARACNACALKPLCTGKIRHARPGAAQKVVATRLVGLTFKVKNFLLNETNHEWLGP